jgi:hypothetical protein
MKIILTPDTALKLMTYANYTAPQEFSGLGFVRLTPDKDFEIYDFVVLDVGSMVYTEIPAAKLLPLLSRPDAGAMKAFLHRHPMGNDKPGDHNWSGTDVDCILNTPLGGVPALVKWSISVVITPWGWVGRYDNYVQKKTTHLEVLPDIAVFRRELTSVSKAGAEAEKQRIYATLDQVEEAIATFDPALAQELGLDEESLWEMLTDKVDWGDHVPLSYSEWCCGEGVMDDVTTIADFQNMEVPDWRQWVYGGMSKQVKGSNDESRQTQLDF